MSNRLDAEQVAAYNRDGYIQYHQPVFSEDQFARLKAIFEENLERYGEDNLDLMHMRDDRLLEFLLSDEALDLVQSLIGEDIGIWSSHFISKSPYTGKATPWHEDSSYWNGRVSTMEGICTIWLAIDEATAENGSMGVIPGTHSNGYSNYEPVDSSKNIFGSQIVGVDESKAVYMALLPNQCSLHEARIVHGAKANTSPKRRAGYTMRYFPTTSLVYPERNVNHKLWLARGKDRAGNTYVNV
ncbi:MAG: phytanoyl-CoA dioxygenase family protein [Armatimonas sp.]